MERKEMEKINLDKYIGDVTKIETAEYRNMQFGSVIFLESEIIPFKDDDKLPSGTNLKASLILPLLTDSEDNVYIGIDSKTDKFLKTKKIEIAELPEFEVGLVINKLCGLKCKLQKNDKGFLTLI